MEIQEKIMKKIMKKIISVIAALLIALAAVIPSFAEEEPMEKEYRDALSDFSAKLYTIASNGEEGNYTMSPVSVFMALAMLHGVGDDVVKRDVEEFTGMSAGDLSRAGELCRSLIRRSTFDGKVTCALDMTNSVWIDEGINVDAEAAKELEELFDCFAKSVPFFNDNKAANDSIADFVKKKTNGLIDRKFDFDMNTVFVLLNTLYLKDSWDIDGDLSTTYKYFYTDGGIKIGAFANGYYVPGQAAENDLSYYFYSRTTHGYKLKFIMPKDGVTLDEAMSAPNVGEINKTSDFCFEDENGALHYTRCRFPEFKIESDTDLFKKFTEGGYLGRILPYYGFDSAITDDADVAVSKIVHGAVLDVNKKGIEGAAYTAIAGDVTSAADPSVKIYHDFVINKNFGFILTDANDVILFEGQVRDPFESAAVLGEDEHVKGITERYDGLFALDVNNSDDYKGENVGSVKFTLSLSDERFDFVSVDGVAPEKVSTEKNDDGTVTIEVSDLERIASVAAGDVLFRINFKNDNSYDGSADIEAALSGAVRLSYSLTDKPKGTGGNTETPNSPASPKTESKQTGDAVTVYLIASGVSTALLLVVTPALFRGIRKKKED